ncbi:MAG: hypothetical protein RBU21_16815, partial [FCB group bacterium]|nr:hypothetical protein [FCB group bacterium]
YLERAAHHYSYDDYRESVSPMDPMGRMSPQSMMVHSAILSGLYKEEEAARQDFDLAMQYLSATIERRRKYWLNMPPPTEAHDPAVLQAFPDIKRRHELRKAQWEEARQAAESGEVFREGSKELILAETAVDCYRSSFGNDVPAESVPRLMGPILKKYPGTPMARFAQAIIEKAKQDGLIQGQTTK